MVRIAYEYLGCLGEESKAVEIPKVMVIEKIHSRGGSELVERANDELPYKVELDTDGELLQKFDLDPEELRDEFERQSPAAT